MLKLTEKNRKWWILVAMVSSISMIFIDISVLPVALPTIQRTLNFSDLGLQWIVNAYTLVLSIFVLTGGRMGDLFGYKKIFCIGLLLFSLGSILCGLSYVEWWFIASRAFQGLGGALLIPSAAAIIFRSFPPQQRGKAMGLYVSMGSVFLALGPFIGGVFSEYISWRLVFWINPPIALIGFLLILFCVPKIKGTRQKFDWIGFLTCSVGIGCLIIPTMQAKEWGWLSPLTLGLIIFGIFLFTLLYVLDRQVEDPYINFSLFKTRTFSGTIIVIFITQFIIMVTVFWAIYFQNIFDYTPAQAGAISLLANAPIMIAAPIGGHLLDKKGPRIPIIIGFSLVIFSLFWFLQNLENRNLFILLSAIIPFGCGIPLILTPSFTTLLSEVSPEKRGMVSGTATMIRQFGGTLGLAIIGGIFLTLYQSQLNKDLKMNPLTVNEKAENFEGLLSNAPEALEHLKPLPKQAQSFVEHSSRYSMIHSFLSINALAMALAGVGLGFTLWLIRKKTQPQI